MTNLDSVSKRQRNHFANKGLYSQSYGFSSSHPTEFSQGRQEENPLMLPAWGGSILNYAQSTLFFLTKPALGKTS